MEKLLFIINRLHLIGSGKEFSHLILKYLDQSKFDYDIYYSEYKGHAAELAFSNRDKYDIIVAAGGDGTVNEVAKALAGSGTRLGIIPLGSGNGLARTLMKRRPSIVYSLQVINAFNVRQMDAGLINGKFFFNMAGIGFDANVAQKYNTRNKRGFISYLQTVMSLFFHFQSQICEVSYESHVHTIKAFLISFANSSQWGYNIHICPGANPFDGLLGVTIIRPFPKALIPIMACRLLNKKINKSRFVQMFMTDSIRVKSPGEIIGHIDGDPVIFKDDISVVAVHNAVKVLTI
jgi:diacylglycerol kinase (ATP)